MGTESNPAGHPAPETAAAAELEQTLFEVKRVIVGPGQAGRAPAGGAARRRPLPARRCAGGGQDAGRVDPGHDGRRLVLADPVHARPGALGHRGHPDLPGVEGVLRRRAGPDHGQPGAGRRDQPGAGQGAVRPAGGDGRAAGLDRRQLVQGPRPVPGAGHPEPDRVRGRLPPAGGAAGPVPDEGRRRLPDRRRGAGHPLPDERRAAGRPPGARPGPAARPAEADPQGLRAPRPRRVRRAPRARHPRAGPVRRQRDRQRSSRTGPARAPPSAWSPRPGRWRCCAAATTCCPTTSRELAVEVIAHRLVLSFDAVADGVSAESVVDGSSRPCRRPGSPRSRTRSAGVWRRHERASRPRRHRPPADAARGRAVRGQTGRRAGRAPVAPPGADRSPAGSTVCCTASTSACCPGRAASSPAAGSTGRARTRCGSWTGR